MTIEIVILSFQNKKLNSILQVKRQGNKIGLSVGDKISNLNEFLDGKFSLNLPKKQNNSIVLIFFSNKCPACVSDVKEWQKITLTNNNVKVLGISLSDMNETNNFININNIDFDVIIDHEKKIAKNFGVISLPTKIFINKNKIIEYIYIGSGSKKNQKEFDKMLRKANG